ncbi:MAK10-like protein [Tanacetum coccineum]|uniref:MAK10-like protein n=1 Tax=Tanacetum coccineum TaxID=301880 RepID=A0ABQ5G3C2_9ASTR
MGDANHVRTLGDYSKPSHEGYRNTIELLVGNNVVPLRSDTIWLVQNGCSFHGLQSEDPNQHLKDFLKLVDSLDLDGENKERTRLQGLVSNFMASQDARLSKFEVDFKQQQSEMTNKIDTVLKAITDQMAGALPSDTLNIRLLEKTDHILKLADGTKSYPVGIVKDVEVRIGKLKLLKDFYVIDMKKDPETPLLVGRGFLATANVVIDYRKAKIAIGEGITRESYKPSALLVGRIGVPNPYYARRDLLDCHLPGEWEIARDAKTNPFKDVLMFRRTVEFLGALPINLKRNMWESKDLIKNPINWDKPPKDGDGAWHAKIRIIDPDGEEFTKTLQSISTTRKLSERESPSEIINLD